MIRTLSGDITKIKNVEAIVNAANITLLGGGGVDGAIHRAAGPQLLLECLKLKGCKVGEAKITRAYRLPCEYIIHTVGPKWHGGQYGEQDQLIACYYNTLTVAQKNGIRRLAFPSIATGVYRYPASEAAKVAINTIKQYMHIHKNAIEEVYFVFMDESTREAYDQVLESR
nr:O-acetyl-ADP-ribose deacetylase [uncultured Cellulosilyticum sp.]